MARNQEVCADLDRTAVPTTGADREVSNGRGRHSGVGGVLSHRERKKQKRICALGLLQLPVSSEHDPPKGITILKFTSQGFAGSKGRVERKQPRQLALHSILTPSRLPSPDSCTGKDSEAPSRLPSPDPCTGKDSEAPSRLPSPDPCTGKDSEAQHTATTPVRRPTPQT